jgi:hypothetical protein
VLCAAALVLAGCATNLGPKNYTTEVRDNYQENCIEGSTQRLSSSEAATYCECTYKQIEEKIDFDLFKDFESYLRQHVGDDVDSADDLDNTKYKPIIDVFEGCAPQGPSAGTPTTTPTTSAPR